MGQSTDPLEIVQSLEEILSTEKDPLNPSGVTITAVAHVLKKLFQMKDHPNHSVATTKLILMCQNWLNEFKAKMKPSAGYR